MNGRPLIFGEVLFDRFPDGSEVLGGAPFNVAWNLRGLGLDPLFVSRVGDDELGARIRAAMEGFDLDTSGLQVDREHATGTVEVDLSSGDPRFDIVAERAYDFIEAGEIPDVSDVAVLYHGSLALRGARSRQTFEELRERCGAPLFLDVNLRAPWWRRETILELVERAWFVKVNDAELSELVPGKEDEAAAALIAHPATEHLCITRGSAGAALVSDTGKWHEIEPDGRVEVVDAVGAGDAFASVLISGCLSGWPLDTTLSRAQEFASSIVGVRGATVDEGAFYRSFKDHWSNR